MLRVISQRLTCFLIGKTTRSNHEIYTHEQAHNGSNTRTYHPNKHHFMTRKLNFRTKNDIFYSEPTIDNQNTCTKNTVQVKFQYFHVVLSKTVHLLRFHQSICCVRLCLWLFLTVFNCFWLFLLAILWDKRMTLSKNSRRSEFPNTMANFVCCFIKHCFSRLVFALNHENAVLK